MWLSGTIITSSITFVRRIEQYLSISPQSAVSKCICTTASLADLYLLGVTREGRMVTGYSVNMSAPSPPVASVRLSSSSISTRDTVGAPSSSVSLSTGIFDASEIWNPPLLIYPHIHLWRALNRKCRSENAGAVKSVQLLTSVDVHILPQSFILLQVLQEILVLSKKTEKQVRGRLMWHNITECYF